MKRRKLKRELNDTRVLLDQVCRVRDAHFAALLRAERECATLRAELGKLENKLLDRIATLTIERDNAIARMGK